MSSNTSTLQQILDVCEFNGSEIINCNSTLNIVDDQQIPVLFKQTVKEVIENILSRTTQEKGSYEENTPDVYACSYLHNYNNRTFDIGIIFGKDVTQDSFSCSPSDSPIMLDVDSVYGGNRLRSCIENNSLYFNTLDYAIKFIEAEYK